jgi:SPP1 family predicted phage head-tail adaptor
MSYIPLTIQIMDPATEEWTDRLHLHASKVNKTGGGESFAAGAEQYHPRLTFTVPWCKALEDVAYNTQLHRIVYRGRTYDIQDYDDYMEQHIEVNLVGVAYG